MQTVYLPISWMKFGPPTGCRFYATQELCRKAHPDELVIESSYLGPVEEVDFGEAPKPVVEPPVVEDKEIAAVLAADPEVSQRVRRKLVEAKKNSRKPIQ